MTRAAEPTMRVLYGRGLPRWSRSLIGAIQNLRREQRMSRWMGPCPEKIALPSDAVLIPVRQGLLVASAQARLILKIDAGERKPSLKQEARKALEVWNLAAQAGVAEHLPELLDHGEALGNTDWILYRLAPNTRPFLGKHNARPFHNWLGADWLHWLRQEILPVMECFYDASGVELLNADHVLDDETEKLRRGASADVFQRLRILAERARPARAHPKVARALIHADLTPYHVHRDETCWKIIDWEMAQRKEIIWEPFGKYLWHPHVSRKQNKVFWAWLRGDVATRRLSRALRSELQIFLEWRNSWRKLSADENTLRYQILVLLLRDMRKTAERHDVIHLLSAPPHKRTLHNHERLKVRHIALQVDLLGLRR